MSCKPGYTIGGDGGSQFPYLSPPGCVRHFGRYRVIARDPLSVRPPRGRPPASVFFEIFCDDDKCLTVVRSADVIWVDPQERWRRVARGRTVGDVRRERLPWLGGLIGSCGTH